MNLQKSVRVFIGISILIAFSAMVRASTTYEYTGLAFNTVTSPYTTSDSVTGSFTMSVPLGPSGWETITPDSFSFTDGVQTITNLTPGFPIYFGLDTDANGDIADWDIVIGTAGCLNCLGTDGMETIFYTVNGYNSQYAQINGSEYGYNYYAGPGSWTSTTSSDVPESGPLSLLGTGLLGLGFVARKRVNR